MEGSSLWRPLNKEHLKEEEEEKEVVLTSVGICRYNGILTTT